MAEEATTLAFSVRAETSFGQAIRVVGSSIEFGNWDPAKAPSLATDAADYPKWTGNLPCAAGATEYKFVKFDPSKPAIWEDGTNRYFEISAEGDVLGRDGKPEESTNTPVFNGKDKITPRLTSGRTRKTSFSDEEEVIAVPVPVTPKAKVPTSTTDFNDELHFNVVCSLTGLGDHVSVVGGCPELGNWDVKKGIKLCTSGDLFPQWAGVVHLQSCAFRDVEFKVVVVRVSRVDWESNHNRRLSMPDGDEEGPWQAVMNYNVNGVQLAKFRTSPVNSQQGSQEDPSLVKAALQDNAKQSKVLVHSATAGCNEHHRRSTSLSLLGNTAPLVAEQWGRCRELSGPPVKEQLLILKLKGIDESDAKKMFVEIVFEARSQKPTLPLDLTAWEPQDLQAAWSIAATGAGLNLNAGMHYFHFRVNGVFALSGEHIRIGKWNALYHGESIRRYLLARDARGQLLDGGRMVEKTRSKRIGDMVIDSVVGDASSADQVGLQERDGQSMARPYSVCGHMAQSDSEEEVEKQDGANAFAPFAKEVYEGLFDRELALRLDGLVLPEVPEPPLGRADVEVECALRLWAGAHLIKKAHGACEDAYFVAPHGMGVADGVGCMVQFASYGINAAQYATELMEFSSAALKDGIASETKIPNDVAQRAATALQHGESHAAAYGASTVAVLCQQGNFIGVANLGDSGFMVLRKGPHGMSVVIKSEEQQHSWNCPYQLTRLPKTLLTRFPKLQLDKAADCERYTAPIREGDLVIMFSDGLRDNLHDREVVSLVNRTLPPPCADLVGLLDRCTPPETIAKSLALAAQERSMDPTAKVPFVEYSRKHGFECIGGKQDDITVVCAWVVADESQPNPDALDLDEIIDEMNIKEAAEAAAKEAERAKLAAEEAARQEAERAKIAAEEAARQEAERAKLAAEEAARQEAERAKIAAEEAARQEAERAKLAAEEAARQEAERAKLAAEEAARQEAERAKLAAEEAERGKIAAEEEEERAEAEELARAVREAEEAEKATKLAEAAAREAREVEEAARAALEAEVLEGEKSPATSNMSYEYSFAPEGDANEEETEGKSNRRRKAEMARGGSGRIHVRKSSGTFERKYGDAKKEFRGRRQEFRPMSSSKAS